MKSKVKYKDLTNQKFGKLTVISPSFSKKQGTGVLKFWLCLCDCGNTTIASGHSLRKGFKKSCGCATNAIDLTNQRFGKLLAICKTEKRNSNNDIMWKCLCDCGNTCYVSSHKLKTNYTLSCGCLISQGEMIISNILRENNISFEKQKTFENCRFEENNLLARFDFFVENKYIIEFDGKQHFVKSGWKNGKTLEQIQERDEFKNNWCKKNNIPIIRIPYTHLKDICLNDLLLEKSCFILK